MTEDAAERFAKLEAQLQALAARLEQLEGVVAATVERLAMDAAHQRPTPEPMTGGPQ